jgi:hypothetical protein
MMFYTQVALPAPVSSSSMFRSTMNMAASPARFAPTERINMHTPIRPAALAVLRRPLIAIFENDCGWTATVPFDLGSKFQVSTSADVDVSLEPGPFGNTIHGSDDAIVVFRLLEADGKTPVPFSAMPEPATWGLLLFGLAAGPLVYRKRLQMR